MPTQIITDDSLLKRLTAAASRGATPDELRQQRLSFVYGNLPRNSSMTRHQVEAVLEHIDKADGRR
ncbi:MAG: hypothetical protein C0499_09600 [Zymomonas sp.]|nr:hypothetical protein [Zymomonas sp.]